MAFNTEVQTGLVSAQKKFLTKVYGWMALALVISGITAFAGSEYINNLIATKNAAALGTIRYLIIGLSIGEIVLVWWLSSSIRKISPVAAGIGFIVYSVINGLTLSTIFVFYNAGTIWQAFATASVTFLAMVLYGTFSKADIQSAGKYLYMGLLGIVIASVIQWIVSLITGQSFEMLSLIISIVTVIVFTGLTAYDTNKMLKISEHADDSDMFTKASIIGALELYLDFINIFLALLRIFGRNRD